MRTTLQFALALLFIAGLTACDKDPAAPETPSYNTISVNMRPDSLVSLVFGERKTTHIMLCVPRGMNVEMDAALSNPTPNPIQSSWSIGVRAGCADSRDLVDAVVDIEGMSPGEATVSLTFVFSRGDPIIMTFKVKVSLPPGCTSSSGYSSTTGQPCGVPVPGMNLWADETSIPFGGGSILRWHTVNANSCVASSGVNGWAGNKVVNGSFYTGPLFQTTVFILTCWGRGGQASSSTTIRVFIPRPPTVPTPGG